MSTTRPKGRGSLDIIPMTIRKPTSYWTLMLHLVCFNENVVKYKKWLFFTKATLRLIIDEQDNQYYLINTKPVARVILKDEIVEFTRLCDAVEYFVMAVEEMS